MAHMIDTRQEAFDRTHLWRSAVATQHDRLAAYDFTGLRAATQAMIERGEEVPSDPGPECSDAVLYLLAVENLLAGLTDMAETTGEAPIKDIVALRAKLRRAMRSQSPRGAFPPRHWSVAVGNGDAEYAAPIDGEDWTNCEHLVMTELTPLVLALHDAVIRLALSHAAAGS